MNNRRNFLGFFGASFASTNLFGYYTVTDFFKETQSKPKSLGSCAIYAPCDSVAFEKLSKEEFKSIVASSNVKIYMKIEDPEETIKLF